MLATMNITKGVDENGAVIEPSGEYESAMTHAVKPFACSMHRREARSLEIV